jgi:hypothetical protein
MLRTSGKPSRKMPKRKHFFWEGKLHKAVRINRPANLVEAYRFEDGKMVTLLYTDYIFNSSKAYRMNEVATLLGISTESLKKYIQRDAIPNIQIGYPVGDPEGKSYRWYSEENVLGMHDVLINTHRGRPRKDGKITPRQDLPTKAELRARLDGTKRLYLETEDGLVPLFEQPKW